jgi:ABC-type uncharacterized transport system auxiliary subunit
MNNNCQEGDTVYTVKIKKMCSFELLVPTNQTARCYNSERHNTRISSHLSESLILCFASSKVTTLLYKRTISLHSDEVQVLPLEARLNLSANDYKLFSFSFHNFCGSSETSEITPVVSTQ